MMDKYDAWAMLLFVAVVVVFTLGLWAGDKDAKFRFKQCLIENNIAVNPTNPTNGVTSFQIDTNKLPVIPKWLE